MGVQPKFVNIPKPENYSIFINTYPRKTKRRSLAAVEKFNILVYFEVPLRRKEGLGRLHKTVYYKNILSSTLAFFFLP